MNASYFILSSVLTILSLGCLVGIIIFICNLIDKKEDSVIIEESQIWLEF